jgi:hypothetical protein
MLMFLSEWEVINGGKIILIKKPLNLIAINCLIVITAYIFLHSHSRGTLDALILIFFMSTHNFRFVYVDETLALSTAWGLFN